MFFFDEKLKSVNHVNKVMRHTTEQPANRQNNYNPQHLNFQSNHIHNNRIIKKLIEN